jgi:tetratricopeptide (TPR) repeat protein
MHFGQSFALGACVFFATALGLAEVNGASSAREVRPEVPVQAASKPVASSSASDEPSASASVEDAESVEARSAKAAVTAASKTHPAAKPRNASAYKDGKGVRHDAAGKQGISPYSEAIRAGDEAALAGDLAKAEASYVTAIEIDPKHPIAHLRRGQALLRAGQLTQAELVYQQALKLTSSDTTLHASALFVLAELKERQGLRDEAIAAWRLYAEYVKKEPSAKAYRETPAEREKRLTKYKELAADSKAVRERIELRVKEVDEANRRKAAQNPNANR